MVEYIEREAFIARQRELYCQNCDRRRGMKDGKLTKRFVYPIGGAPCRACDVDDMINAVEDFPAADVVPVRHGKWIWDPDGMDWGLGAWCCSECKSKAETWWANDKKYNPLHCSGGHFCGNCGALMDKDGDRE